MTTSNASNKQTAVETRMHAGLLTLSLVVTSSSWQACTSTASVSGSRLKHALHTKWIGMPDGLNTHPGQCRCSHRQSLGQEQGRPARLRVRPPDALTLLWGTPRCPPAPAGAP